MHKMEKDVDLSILSILIILSHPLNDSLRSRNGQGEAGGSAEDRPSATKKQPFSSRGARLRRRPAAARGQVGRLQILQGAAAG